MITPVLSRTYPLSDAIACVECMRGNRHVGKISVLCLAPREGPGIERPEMRVRIGEDRLSLFSA
ncbi:hypothetical protein [Methylobacterium sp. CM6247]